LPKGKNPIINEQADTRVGRFTGKVSKKTTLENPGTTLIVPKIANTRRVKGPSANSNSNSRKFHPAKEINRASLESMRGSQSTSEVDDREDIDEGLTFGDDT